MKKLFTFAAAVLASVSMFAATIDDVTVIDDSYSINFDEVMTATVAKENLIGEYFFSPLGNNYANNKGNLDGHLYCLRVKSASQDALGFKLDRAATLVLYADRVSDRAPKLNTEIAVSGDNLIEGIVEVGAEGQRWGKVTYAIPAGGTYYIVGTGDCFLARLEFTLEAKCEDPELTVSPTEGTGFVGDAIDIAVTSKNQSKPINAAVTVDGVAGEYGTDYTFSVSTGLVQATPLRAGTFVITFSQASNGTYCDAEESATFVISAKDPCTSFDIDAPASARVDDEVTVTLSNFNAAPTTIVWYDGDFNEITAANGKTSYTFTPDAAGNYMFQVTAWNAYNTENVDEAYNYAIINVSVGHNAKLSSLKINGETIDGFKDDKFEYDLGEIGVYEPVEVTAIPADDPYATATVNPGLNNVLITVFAQDKTTYKEYTIKYTRKAATELASISGNTTWDWADAGSATAEFTNETMPTKSEEFNFADVLISPAESFNAAALAGTAQFANRGEYVQGTKVRFHTTVDGTIEVSYQNTSNRDESGRRWVVVNDKKVGDGAIDQKNWYVAEADVKAGDVIITFVDTNDAGTMLRINKLVFTKDEGGETALDNIEAGQVVKAIENGQLVIIKNGIRYNAQGAVVK